jgi:hypothetical protein
LVAALGLIAAIPIASALTSPSPASPVDDDRLRVAKVHGRAFHVKSGGVHISLGADAPIQANRPVKVGPKSRLDLRLRDGGALELGPAAQLVLFPTSREGHDNARRTGLRLDTGYLRLLVPAAAHATRLEIAFGAWSTQLQPGEYLIEAQGDQASVCTVSGSLQISGAAGPIDAPEPGHCLRLAAQSATQVALETVDLERITRRRALLASVMDAATRERTQAVSRLEETYSRNPDAPIVEADAIARMPRVRRSGIAVAAPLSTTWIESTERRLDRQIARQQARLADDLIASAPTKAGSSKAPAPVAATPNASLPPPAETEIAYTESQTLSMSAPAAPDPAAPAPAPEPTGAAEPAAPSSLAGEWIVNVATHASLESAQAQAQLLKARNYATTIRRETIRGRSAYRVVVEGLPTEQAAASTQSTLASEFGFRKAWVFRKR